MNAKNINKWEKAADWISENVPCLPANSSELVAMLSEYHEFQSKEETMDRMFSAYKKGATDEANEKYDPMNPNASFIAAFGKEGEG